MKTPSWTRFFVSSLLSLTLVPCVGYGQMQCIDVLSGDSSSQNQLVAAMRALSQPELEALRPQTPSERLAWLQVLSERPLGQALVSRPMEWPTQRHRRKSLNKILSKNPETWTYGKVNKINKLVYSEHYLYFELLWHLSHLQLKEANEMYIEHRLTSELRLKGLIEGLQKAGVLKSEGLKEHVQEILVTHESEFKSMIEAVAGVAGIYSLIESGKLSGGTLPVVPLVKLKNISHETYLKIVNDDLKEALPFVVRDLGIKGRTETINVVVSRTLQLALFLIIAAILGDKILDVFNLDPQDRLDEWLNNRTALEQAALGALEKDAGEMQFNVTKDPATLGIHALTIRQLKTTIGGPNVVQNPAGNQ